MKKLNENSDLFEDVIFENRNKDYGAYYLRKSYSKHLTTGIIIATTFCLVASTVPLVANYFKGARILPVDDEIEITWEPTTPPEADELEKIIPPPADAIDNLIKSNPFLAPKPTIDLSSSDDLFLNIDDYKFGGDQNGRDNDSFDLSTMRLPKEIDDKEEDTVLISVDEFPEFPGGYEAMSNFLKENIEYPEMERIYGVMGKVVVTFIVEKDGSLSRFSINAGVTENIDNEALRVVNQMPKWSPGKIKGKPVRTEINVPIRFTLN